MIGAAVGVVLEQRFHAHRGRSDHAVGSDHMARRHRQTPRRVVVERRQVVAERSIEPDQRGRQLKANAESGGQRAVGVAQYWKPELVLAL